MPKCIIVGSGSDIAQEMMKRLSADGWSIEAYAHDGQYLETEWDLLILFHGRLHPIGRFFDTPSDAWLNGVRANAFVPLNFLRAAWPNRNANSTVVFLGGPNMKHTSPTYTAYRAGKAMLESLVDTLGAEYPDAKFRILHPGVVNTKIHQQTLQAGHRAHNYERVMKIVNGMEPTVSHDEVYQKLKALL